MTSDKQIQANRLNAQLGGVKSPEGKEISRFNAVKHRILSNALTKEEEKEIEELSDYLLLEYDPQNKTEEILVERIITWTIRLRRAVNAEKEQWLKIYNPRLVRSTLGGTTFDSLTSSFEEVIQEGYYPKVQADEIELLDKTYLRYETSIERNLYKALHELQRIQAARNGEKPPLPLAVDLTIDSEKEIDSE